MFSPPLSTPQLYIPRNHSNGHVFFSLPFFHGQSRDTKRRQLRSCRFFVGKNASLCCARRLFLCAAVALSAVGTAIADEAAGAFPALAAVVRRVAIAVGDGPAKGIAQEKVLGASLMVHAGAVGHAALQALGRQVVGFAVFDETGAGLDEAEGGVGADAFVVKALHPFKMAGTCAVVVFAAADDLLDLACGEGGRQADRADEGRAHDAFVLEGQIEQQRQAFVGTALVFAGDVEEDVVPAVAPVAGQAVGNALRALGEQVKDDVAALAHDGPGFVAPGVGLGQEEIRGHADADEFTGADFIVAVAIFGEGVAHIGGAIDTGAVVAGADTVEVVHVAMVAALTDFDAAVPRVPDIVHGAASFPVVIVRVTKNPQKRQGFWGQAARGSDYLASKRTPEVVPSGREMASTL